VLNDKMTLNVHDLFVTTVKRAKEAIMFGNQQNEAKEMAKRDGNDDHIDEQGSVYAKEPVDIEAEEDPMEEANAEEGETGDGDSMQVDNEVLLYEDCVYLLTLFTSNV